MYGEFIMEYEAKFFSFSENTYRIRRNLLVTSVLLFISVFYLDGTKINNISGLPLTGFGQTQILVLLIIINLYHSWHFYISCKLDGVQKFMNIISSMSFSSISVPEKPLRTRVLDFYASLRNRLKMPTPPPILSNQFHLLAHTLEMQERRYAKVSSQAIAYTEYKLPLFIGSITILLALLKLFFPEVLKPIISYLVVNT